MDESLKLNWKMRYEWFPNEKYLKGFDNLLTAYLPKDGGRILDIGCGQSEYIIDMLGTNFELYAQDDEVLQVDYLQQRIRDQGFPLERVNYCTSRFPNSEFTGKFDGIIISNILHFYSLNEIQKTFLPSVFDLLKPGSILVVTVHSAKHPSNKQPINKESYFKHFFTRADLNSLFPKEQFQTLYYQTKTYQSPVYDKEFCKAWIKQFHHESGVFDNKTIERAQKEYLKDGREDNITVAYKMKNTSS